jgi:hypothetical protein
MASVGPQRSICHATLPHRVGSPWLSIPASAKFRLSLLRQPMTQNGLPYMLWSVFAAAASAIITAPGIAFNQSVQSDFKMTYYRADKRLARLPLGVGS